MMSTYESQDDRIYTLRRESTYPVLKRFALIVDGMTKAALVSNGPFFIHQLAFNNHHFQLATLERTLFLLSVFLSVCVLGRWLGVVLSNILDIPRRVSSTLIARMGGLALLLLYVTTTGWIGSVHWLLLVRFASSMLAGLLVGATHFIALPEDQRIMRGDLLDSDSHALSSDDGLSALSPGVVRLYAVGFALSMSFQLFLQSGTGAASLLSSATLSPGWLVVLVVALEIMLRFVFSMCASSDDQCAMSVPPGRGQLGSTNRVKLIEPSIRVAFPDEPPFSRLESIPLSELGNHHLPVNSSLRSRRDTADYSASARSRKESFASLDEFFDCRSVLSDLENVVLFDDDDGAPDHEMKIARYMNHRCVFADGTSAFVPPGESPCIVPSTYLNFYKGSRSRAQQAWEETQRWRYEKLVWRIHTLPNPWFLKIKEAYPHFVHGYSKQGFPIIYEQPGRMELKRLFAEGCGVDDMLYHYTFFMEFVSNIICTKDEIRAKLGPDPAPHSSSTWGIMVVMDVKGAGLSQLSGNVARYVKNAGDINSAHYPTSMKRAFLINAPFWLGGAWSGIKGILPESVQVDILSPSKFASALREYIDEDQIPPEYGGTSPYQLGEHPFEVELQQLVDQAAAANSEPLDEKQLPLVISTSASDTYSFDGGQDHVAANLQSPSIETRSCVTTGVPLRRRIHSVDRAQAAKDIRYSWKGHRQESPSSKVLQRFVVVTMMHMGLNGVMAALELVLPFWILLPTKFGGLGQSPQRNCVLLLCATLVVLWVSKRRQLGMAFRLCGKSPLRVYRMSVGLESAVLVGLSAVAFRVPDVDRRHSVILTTTAIIALAVCAILSFFGRAASKSWHLSESISFAGRRIETSDWLLNLYGAQQLVADCESGRFTGILTPIAEILGLLLTAGFFSKSFESDSMVPISVMAAFSLSLYFLSMIVAQPTSDQVPSNHRRCACGYRTNHCLPFLGEAMAVSTSDMASLMEEGHWSSTPILSRRSTTRGRCFSETSALSESNQLPLMDRGDGSSMSTQKAK